MNAALYKAQWLPNQPPGQAREYAVAYDLHNSRPTLLNVTVQYNDSTQLSSGFGAPRAVRLTQPINAIVAGFLAALSAAAAAGGGAGAPDTVAAILGIKEVRARVRA